MDFLTVLFPTMPMIKLQSSDGEVFDVDVEIAKASNTIKTMIEGVFGGQVIWYSN